MSVNQLFIFVIDMVFSICLLCEYSPPDTIDGYPFRSVFLTRLSPSYPLAFPTHSGSIHPTTGAIDSPSEQLNSLFTSFPPTSPIEFRGITDNAIAIFLVRNLPIPSPQLLHLETTSTSLFALMDEVRQGRVCHAVIDSKVRNLFFSSTEGIGVPTEIPYFYEPNANVLPFELALVPVPTDRTPDSSILHNREFYKIPMVGYHGTAEQSIAPILVKGLAPTMEKGMYGNNAYYFGSFFKAIRYAFRDSQYSTMGEQTALRKSYRPSGFLEMPNTLQRNKTSTELVTDLVRDSPALIRYVVFAKRSVFLPRELKGSTTLMTELSNVTNDAFVSYKFEDGYPSTIFEEDYLQSQVGKDKPLFEPGDTLESLGVPTRDEDDYTIPPGSTRGKVALSLYQTLHVATEPAFPS